MKRYYYVIIAFLACIAKETFAQTVRGDFDLTAYPEVSFVWNEYDPDIKDSTQFSLSSDGEKIPVQIANMPYIDTLKTPKTILFLWEDLNHRSHGMQSQFTQIALYNFLKDLPPQGLDKFNVAVFDRKGGNDTGNSIHSWLSKSFTDNPQQLAEVVRTYDSKYDMFSNQQNSELYLAIEEGITQLERELSDRIRAIVVFTAGSNLDNYGGRNSIDETRAKALKIPVYVVKYPIKGCEHCTNIDLISKNTNGLTVTTDNIQTATNLLRQCYDTMSKRHHGQDYRISFSAPFKRDGKQHTVILNISGKEYPLTITSPAFSLTQWIREHILYSVIIGVILLIILLLVVWLIIRIIKKRRQKIIEIEIRLQQESEANRAAIEDYKRQQEANEQEAKQREQQEHFARLIQTKNLYPRLQYSIDNKVNTFTVSKPETIIGRDETNDLVLPNDSVSRRHAKIIFNGSAFEIEDLGSSNHVIVNGAFVTRAQLHNGDIIGLGEIIVYFNV
ncbi:MAG: FHA domain-containing protein [Tannerella sp.]|nr:FHA domain-containing protein [Tannerella sp.]